MIFIADLFATVLLTMLSAVAIYQAVKTSDGKRLPVMFVALIVYATIRIGAELF